MCIAALFGPIPALATAWDSHFLSVLRNGSTRNTQALFLQFVHQIVIAHRVGFVFFVDDFLKLDANRLVGDIFPVGALSAENKEPSQRQDSAWRLNPFVVNRSGYRRYVNAYLVGNLLHLERLDCLWTFIQETLLVVNDSLRDSC